MLGEWLLSAAGPNVVGALLVRWLEILRAIGGTLRLALPASQTPSKVDRWGGKHGIQIHTR